MPPSFRSAKELRFWIENLPDVPRWNHQEIKLPGYHTKKPMIIYWRDGLEVIKYIFANPVFAHCMEYTPYELYDKETGLRAYGEFMSGNFANRYQVRYAVSYQAALVC